MYTKYTKPQLTFLALHSLNTSIFATQCRRPSIFLSINSVRSNNLSLKYQRFTPRGCKDKGNGIFKFVAKDSNPFYFLIPTSKPDERTLPHFKL